MAWLSRRRGRGLPARSHARPAPPTHLRVITAGLALLLLVVAVACTPSRSLSSAATASPTHTPNPLSRIHHASPDDVPLFARILFTPDTTYEQAVAILGREPYPWACDEPRSPAPSLGARRAAFAVSRTLLMSYPAWDQLTQIAAALQVVSVEGDPLYPCP